MNLDRFPPFSLPTGVFNSLKSTFISFKMVPVNGGERVVADEVVESPYVQTFECSLPQSFVVDNSVAETREEKQPICNGVGL